MGKGGKDAEGKAPACCFYFRFEKKLQQEICKEGTLLSPIALRRAWSLAGTFWGRTSPWSWGGSGKGADTEGDETTQRGTETAKSSE